MRGVVSCSKNPGRDDSKYYVIEDSEAAKVLELRSSLVFRPGEMITTEDIGDVIHTADIRDGGGDIQRLSGSAADRALKFLNKKHYNTGTVGIDKVTEKMWKPLSSSAELLLRKLACAAPVIVRFHNDADGSSGAYGLYSALLDLASREEQLNYRHNVAWIMHQGVSYGAYDAGSDIMIANNYECIEKPLLIVIDFGTALESNKGLELVKDKFDIIWLDHHPIIEGFDGLKLDHYVNPWNFGGDSNYTAGLLACVFSKTFSSIDTRDAENASLIGDYSSYARVGERGTDLSMILDLLTSDSKVAFGSSTSNLTPYEISKIVGEKERMKELLDFANMRLSEVTAIALTSLKQYKGDAANIYVLDFENIRNEQTKFPLPGRFSSKLLEKIMELNKVPCIVIVHSGKYVSIRVAKELGGKVDLVSVIAELKERNGNEIEAGGGHKSASGIKIADGGDRANVLKETVSIIKRQLQDEVVGK